MSDAPINLNRARKERERAAKRARADTNAVKHGRRKEDRALDTARIDLAMRRLEQNKLDRE